MVPFRPTLLLQVEILRTSKDNPSKADVWLIHYITFNFFCPNLTDCFPLQAWTFRNGAWLYYYHWTCTNPHVHVTVRSLIETWDEKVPFHYIFWFNLWRVGIQEHPDYFGFFFYRLRLECRIFAKINNNIAWTCFPCLYIYTTRSGKRHINRHNTKEKHSLNNRELEQVPLNYKDWK
jgi:hypothetical protein